MGRSGPRSTRERKSTGADRTRSASPSRSHSPDPSSADPSRSKAGRATQGRNVIPACDRCRSFKKKCSRTFPTCSLCASSRQNCSYSAQPVTPEAEALQLRARVQWLSDYINNHLLGSHRDLVIEDVETGSDLVSLLGSRFNPSAQILDTINAQTNDEEAAFFPPPSDPGRVRVEAGLHPTPLRVWNSSTGPPTRSVEESGNETTSPNGSHGVGGHVSYEGSAGTQIPNPNDSIVGNTSLSDAAARRFVDAYFRNVNGAYPFVNQNKILENLDSLGDLAQRLQDSQSTLLYLVMSIGCTALERASQVPRDTTKRLEVAYAEIIQECVCRDSIESVQILMLLALYSLFDPTGAPAYSTVGIAARQATAIGLAHQLADQTACSPAETELRHRLYWSIFALDRLMAVSQGLPVALVDNADVPFPSLTVEEFASPERITYARKLQTSRHVIQLRQLEGQILDEVHFRRQAEIADMTPLDRRAKLSSLRASIEQWYSQGCLISPIGGDNTTIHSTTTWLSARYYYLLLLLYYPNHFNSSARAVSRQDLQQIVQRHLQATAVLFEQQQLPLNCNTLYRLMPLCLVLMHDFSAIYHSASWAAQPSFPFLARDEVAVAVSILEAFPEKWKLAHQAAEVVRQFSGVITGGMAAFFSADGVFPLGDARAGTSTVDGSSIGGDASGREGSISALMKPCIARLTSLMQEMMGKPTCFQFVEYPSAEDDKTMSTSVTSAISHQPVYQPYQQEQQEHRQGPPSMTDLPMNGNDMDINSQVAADDGGVLGYGWGGLELDFL